MALVWLACELSWVLVSFGGGPLGFGCTNRRNLSSPVLGDTVLVCSFVFVVSLLNGQVTFGIVILGIFIPGAFHFAGGLLLVVA